MRILMLNNEFPPLGGGTGVVNYHLLKELAAYSEITVDLVTSSRTRSTFEREQFAERITIYKVPVHNQNIHHSTNPELLRYSWHGIRLCWRLMGTHRYDLSFAFAGVPAGAVSYLLQKTNGLPYIVSLQGPDVPGFEARYNYLYPFLTPLLRKVWGNATAVIAISREHRNLALQTMPDLEIPIIYNGVETESFTPARQPSTTIRLLCVGRLIERKGQQHLLRAFALLRSRVKDHDIRLTLVGTGDNEATLRQMSHDLGIADGVVFRGFVSREHMPAVYHDADVFVLPSQNEGMSIALLEAMASGLPVVVTNTGGTEELVTAGDNGLIVQWGDVNNLADALERLVRQPDRRTKMGARSRARACALSWSEIARQYIEVMQRALAPRGADRSRGSLIIGTSFTPSASSKPDGSETTELFHP